MNDDPAPGVTAEGEQSMPFLLETDTRGSRDRFERLDRQRRPAGIAV